MDIQTLLYKLREEVTCPVCSDVLADPKQLSCLHSFCLKCLKQWHVTCAVENAVKCPKCQTICRIPASGDLKDLPTSFYLNGLIDVLAIKECTNSHVKCGNCDKKSSEASYCFQCCMFYCEICVVAHDIFRSKKGHRVLAIKKFQDKDYEDVLKRPVFCTRQGHQKKLKYFCTECETAVCQTCVTLDHGGHRLKLIEEEAESQKLEIKTLILKQRVNLQGKMKVVTQLDEDYAKLIQHSENVKRDVERFADGLIKTIEAKKQNMIAVVERQTNKSLESLTTKKTEIEREINVGETSLEKADKLLTRSTNAEIVQLKKSLETIFEGVDQTEPIAHDPEGLPALVFVQNQKMHGIVNDEEIGSLEVPYQTKVGGSPFTVQVKPFHVKPVLSFGKLDPGDGMFKCPRGVAMNDRDEIIVCSNHMITIFNSNGKFVRSFAACGQNLGELSFPRGIAVDKDSNIIFVAEGGNHRVTTFSWEGRHLRSFGSQGCLDSQLNRPNGLSLDSNGNIIVVDSGNKLIKIFTTDGRFLMKIGGQSSFSDPVHCVQYGEYLIVSDNAEHCIKVFNREGNFQYKFGKQGEGDGEFDHPCFLSVTKSKHLLVCDKGNNRIQVLELNGNFVGKFGTKGNKLGEFNSPWSVAISSNDQIVVSDNQNHRIHIFQ